MRWLGNYILEWLRGPWPEIWFIRHGHGFHQIGYELVDEGLADSPLTALGVDIPNHEIPLSPLGRYQAEETGKYLDICPDMIYTSQMARAIETARLIFPNREIRTDPRLNEKDFGPAHMINKEKLYELFPLHINRYERDGKYFAPKAPGAENYISMFMRVHSILDTFRRDWAGKRLAVCCHSALMTVVRQLFEHFTPAVLMRVQKEEWIPNCGILHYARPPGLWGFGKGKFRLRLESSPYRLWELDRKQYQRFRDQAMAELPGLREKFSD